MEFGNNQWTEYYVPDAMLGARNKHSLKADTTPSSIKISSKITSKSLSLYP